MTPLQISNFIYELLCSDVNIPPQKAIEYWHFEVLQEQDLYGSIDSVCFYVHIKDGQTIYTIASILKRAYDIRNVNFNHRPPNIKGSKQNNLYLRMFSI